MSSDKYDLRALAINKHDQKIAERFNNALDRIIEFNGGPWTKDKVCCATCAMESTINMMYANVLEDAAQKFPSTGEFLVKFVETMAEPVTTEIARQVLRNPGIHWHKFPFTPEEVETRMVERVNGDLEKNKKAFAPIESADDMDFVEQAIVWHSMVEGSRIQQQMVNPFAAAFMGAMGMPGMPSPAGPPNIPIGAANITAETLQKIAELIQQQEEKEKGDGDAV